MFSRGALAAFATIVAELLLFGFAIRAVGVLFVVLGSLLAAAVGLFLVRRQIPALLSSGKAFVSSLGFGAMGGSADGDATEDQAADRALLILAGLLLIVPGLLTGLLGALLLVPPVRATARGFARARFAHLVPSGIGMPFPAYGSASTHRRGSSRTDVVDVDVVSEDKHRPTPRELG